MFVQTMETKGFFQLEIILDVLVSSYRFIWIHVMGLRQFITFVFFQRGDRLYTSESRFWRIETVPALKSLKRRGRGAMARAMTASPVMQASRGQTPLFEGGVVRETSLFLPYQCD